MAKEPTTFEDIFAEGDEFVVGGRKYRVLPILLKEMKMFREEIFGYNPGYLVEDADKSQRLNYMFEKYVRNAKGESITLQQAMDEEWNIAHLEGLLKKLARVSG